jgi:hypothetical protein
MGSKAWSGMTTSSPTVPATEANLRLEADVHPMQDPSSPVPDLMGHEVLVDGVHARAFVGYGGRWSEGISIEFVEEHPTMGKDWGTKHFHFVEPGRVAWGHEGQTFTILKLLQPDTVI